MKLVIEVPDDLESDEAMKVYLTHMQDESDEAAAESPDDYWDGFGSLSLETRHMATSAKIIGVLHEDSPPDAIVHYFRIEPLPEVK